MNRAAPSLDAIRTEFLKHLLHPENQRPGEDPFTALSPILVDRGRLVLARDAQPNELLGEVPIDVFHISHEH